MIIHLPMQSRMTRRFWSAELFKPIITPLKNF